MALPGGNRQCIDIATYDTSAMSAMDSASSADRPAKKAKATASSVVRNNEWVFLKTNDDKQLFMEASKNKQAKLGRVHCNLGPIIGAPYGSIFEVRGSKLVRVYDGLMPPLSGKDLAFSTDKSMPMNDNRDIVGNNTAQKLSANDIQIMKGQGKSGQEIIDALVSSSDTYQKKTGFSQEKYLRKKLKKYMVRVQVLKTNGHVIGETCFMRSGIRMCHLRDDSLSQLLTYANVHAGQHVLVHETCMGVVMGAVAERLGGHGRVLCSFGGQQPSRDAVRRFNLDAESEKILTPYPLTWLHKLDQDEEKLAAAEEQERIDRGKHVLTAAQQKEKAARLAKYSKAQKEKHRLKKLEREQKQNERPSNSQVRNWLRAKADSLIIASTHDPTSMLIALLPHLKPSCPFVVFCEFVEPLTRCYSALMRLGTVIGIQLSSSWQREFQVLPNRTHPMNDMHSESGFILTGTKVLVNARPADHAIKFGHAPAWRRRSRASDNNRNGGTEGKKRAGKGKKRGRRGEGEGGGEGGEGRQDQPQPQEGGAEGKSVGAGKNEAAAGETDIGSITAKDDGDSTAA